MCCQVFPRRSGFRNAAAERLCENNGQAGSGGTPMAAPVYAPEADGGTDARLYSCDTASAIPRPCSETAQ